MYRGDATDSRTLRESPKTGYLIQICEARTGQQKIEFCSTSYVTDGTKQSNVTVLSEYYD